MGYRVEIRTETREVRDEVTVGCTCDNCGAEMEAFRWGGEPVDWRHGAHNALPITLHGYYGGYFDCEGDPTVILCQACVDKLAKAFPFVCKAIDSTLPF